LIVVKTGIGAEDGTEAETDIDLCSAGNLDTASG